MPASWKGTIGFGLVAIPVALLTAVREHDVALHQVHKSDGSRIRIQRICEAEGTKVDYADIAKGVEASDGSMVVLEKEDLEKLPLPSVDRVEVIRFIPPEQIDLVALDKPYYVEPVTHGGQAYALLREAMERTGRVGLCKVALRTRESLALLRPHENHLVLETIHWPDEIKSPDFRGLSSLPEPREQEISMAVSLIETLSGDFDPNLEHDAYSEALAELVEAKRQGREPQKRPSQENVTDLLAALRASVEASQKPKAEKKPAKRRARKSA